MDLKTRISLLSSPEETHFLCYNDLHGPPQKTSDIIFRPNNFMVLSRVLLTENGAHHPSVNYKMAALLAMGTGAREGVLKRLVCKLLHLI